MKVLNSRHALSWLSAQSTQTMVAITRRGRIIEYSSQGFPKQDQANPKKPNPSSFVAFISIAFEVIRKGKGKDLGSFDGKLTVQSPQEQFAAHLEILLFYIEPATIKPSVVVETHLFLSISLFFITVVLFGSIYGKLKHRRY